MRVLVFTEVRRDLTDFCVELHVNVLLLAKQDCILQTDTHTHTETASEMHIHIQVHELNTIMF